MTFEQRIRELLSKHGLWPEWHVDAVIERCKNHNEFEDTKSVWNDVVEGYPLQFLASLWYKVRRVTVEYIDETIPKVWYRGMFADNPV